MQWVQGCESRVSATSTALPEEMQSYLVQLESQLLTFGSVSVSGVDGDVGVDGMDQGSGSSNGGGSGSGSGSGVSGNIKGMLAVTAMAQKLLRAGASLGGDAFLCVLCRLLRAAMVSEIQFLSFTY